MGPKDGSGVPLFENCQQCNYLNYFLFPTGVMLIKVPDYFTDNTDQVKVAFLMYLLSLALLAVLRLKTHCSDLSARHVTNIDHFKVFADFSSSNYEC